MREPKGLPEETYLDIIRRLHAHFASKAAAGDGGGGNVHSNFGTAPAILYERRPEVLQLEYREFSGAQGLVAAKADVEACDASGRTALYMAASGSWLSTMEQLLQWQARRYEDWKEWKRNNPTKIKLMNGFCSATSAAKSLAAGLSPT